MRWHSFLVRFGLYALAAALAAYAAVLFVRGVKVGPKAICWAEGAFSLLCGVLCLAARANLAAFRRRGPGMLYALALCLGVLYFASYFAWGGLEEIKAMQEEGQREGTLLAMGIVTAVVTLLVIAFPLRKYYNERDGLFTK